MTKPRRTNTAYRNRSPYGWWIASYVERAEWDDEDRSDLNRRCTAWENAILVRARDRTEAWRKAVAVGRLGAGSRFTDSTGRRKGRWRFEGLTSLLPVYERLEDGAEILWQVHARRSVRRIKAMVKSRSRLPIFDDRDAPPPKKRSSGRTRA